MKDAKQFDRVLATVAELLIAENMAEAADLLRKTLVQVDETGWDNWNGGITLWTVSLSVEPRAYAQLGSRREQLEDQISNRLRTVVSTFTDDGYSVKITPRLEVRSDWRHKTADLSHAVRHNIIDGIRIEKVMWHGVLDEVQFLQRVFDLEKLPSYDARFKDAAADIWQHCINNPGDWEDYWVFSDKRLNLVQGSTEIFLRFLCEMVHPVVRPDRNEALKLVKHFNDQLRLESWELVEEEKIAGRSRFSYRYIRTNSGRSVSRARAVADALDAGWMQKEIERLENSVEKDPALAIGTAKDLVESCCKSILNKRGIIFSRSADLGDLTKLLAKELRLVPEGITDEVKGADNIKQILRNLTALTHNLAQLRGLYGSGHGRDGMHRGLEARHARLAVGAAVAFIDFMSATHHQRKYASPADELNNTS